MPSKFEEFVELKYKVYNSLFLELPFEETYQTGIYLPLLTEDCKEGYDQDKSPLDIISTFLTDHFEEMDPKEQLSLLFRFTQYVERQVLLFDSVEDAAYTDMHDIGGKGSINQVFDIADVEGKIPDLITKLNEFGIRIVLTAHPTQFYPLQVLSIQKELQEAIKVNDVNLVRELLNQLGKTPFFKKKQPSPYEEAAGLTWYIDNVFYDSVAEIIEKICARLDISVFDWKNIELIRIGFWPGGDRDGNPFVTPEITYQVAQLLRETALKLYYRDLRKLRMRLTFRGVEDIIENAENKVYNTINQRKTPQYNNPEELILDLIEARANLIESHSGLFLNLLDNLILKVKLYGFFMAGLDARQDSRIHMKAWSQLTGIPPTQYQNNPLSNQENDLIEVLNTSNLPEVEEAKGDEGVDLLQTLHAIKKIQAENGESGCNRYIISNCHSCVDIAIVYRAAKHIWGKEGNLTLDVIPLFESVDDLATASETMKILFRNQEYMEHLKNRNKTQTIMLGFSDGTKDGGYIQANWSIFRAKETLSKIGDEFGVKIVFFDGRGGPPSRGGGNTHNFYAALGDKIHNHKIELTVQGQTISSHYGQKNSCRYNLEQLLTAGLENTLFSSQSQSLSEDQRKLIEGLAEIGYDKYTHLKTHPRFLDYLEKMTPMRFFGQTNIASRPTRRSQGKLTLSDLRAITFVGSWGQMKQNVPGFYGVGTALKSLVDQGRREELTNLYERSLFFRTLLGNSMQSLEKATFKLTSYINKDKEFSELWNTLFQEYKDSIQLICDISGQETLMADLPDGKKSIQMRENIVLPLITIQQFALSELRKESGSVWETEALEKLVVRTMFGIVNAARNAA